MIRRLRAAVAAAVALAGAGAVLVPQHATSLALLAAGTVVVVAAAYLLVLSGPLVATTPPVTALDVGPGPGAPTLEPQGLRDARRDLAARAEAGSLPGPVHDRLVAAGVLPASAPRPAAGGTAGPVTAAALVHRLLDDTLGGTR